MAEQNNEQTKDTGKTFTQAELDAAVESRLARERAKYSDYDTLKDKAAKFDQAQEAAKSELQKAQDRASDFEAKYNASEKALAAMKARSKVASETGVPEALLTGETEEDCKKFAESLLKWRGNAPSAPNRGVDHLLGDKSGKGGTELDAAFSTLRDGLFPEKT